jgi:hypothetical protein
MRMLRFTLSAVGLMLAAASFQVSIVDTTVPAIGLPGDVCHFAIGAVDTAGLVSEMSAIVSKDLR